MVAPREERYTFSTVTKPSTGTRSPGLRLKGGHAPFLRDLGAVCQSGLELLQQAVLQSLRFSVSLAQAEQTKRKETKRQKSVNFTSIKTGRECSKNEYLFDGITLKMLILKLLD